MCSLVILGSFSVGPGNVDILRIKLHQPWLWTLVAACFSGSRNLIVKSKQEIQKQSSESSGGHGDIFFLKIRWSNDVPNALRSIKTLQRNGALWASSSCNSKKYPTVFVSQDKLGVVSRLWAYNGQICSRLFTCVLTKICIYTLVMLLYPPP